MKQSLAAVVVIGLVTLGVAALYGDNLRALSGMSANALAGETRVRSPSGLTQKKLTSFAADTGLPAPAAAPGSFAGLAPSGTVETRADALSTFAIDVDTASWTYARRVLREYGRRPEPASVRVEEWVNAFDYALPAPERAPFAVHVDGATSPFDETKTLVRVALKGREVAPAARKPAHLVFLVDVSGSMAGVDRLPLAVRAVEVLAGQLRADDTVALVTYAGDTRVVLPPTSAANTDAWRTALRSLRAGGGTAMGSGMELAYGLAVRQVRPGTTTRVLVLTDGDANIGKNLGPEAMLEAVHAHVEEGVTLTTVGFGMGNYRGSLLEQLADRGNGQALYVDSEEAIARAFVQQLTGTLEVIAKDVKVQVAFDPAVVTSYRLVGYENRAVADEAFRDDRVDAGELGAGHAVTALYEVTLSPAAGALGTVTVRGLLPDSREPFEVSAPLARAAVARQLAEGPADLRFAAAVALAADHLRGHVAEAWPLEAIARLAEGAAAEQPARVEFAELVRRAAVAPVAVAAAPSADVAGY